MLSSRLGEALHETLSFLANNDSLTSVLHLLFRGRFRLKVKTWRNTLYRRFSLEDIGRKCLFLKTAKNRIMQSTAV